MKTNFTLKSSLMILFLCLGLSSWGQETETLNCPLGSISNNEMVFTTDNFTITHAKGTDSNFAVYSPWRVYTNNTVTFTGGENVQKITSIIITAGSSTYAEAAVNGTLTVVSGTGTVSGASSGSIATLTVTGDDVSEIMLKPSAQTRWSSITINYEVATPPTQVATPNISFSGTAVATDTYLNSTDVTLATSTSGATIYYTTDGNDPTTSSTIYETPFSITSTTVIKAFAVADGLDDSEILTKNITIVNAPENDLCQNAIPLTVNASATNGTLQYATVSGNPFSNSKDVWYTISPTWDAPHTITLSGFSGDADLYLFDQLNSCPTTTSTIASSATTSSTETITHNLVSSKTYYVRIIAYNVAAESDFNISVTSTEPLPTITSSTPTAMTAVLGGNLVTQNITIGGTNLEGDITAVLSDNTHFSVSPSQFSFTGGTLVVTYQPTTLGTHTATVTLSSTGAQDVIINLNGTATLNAPIAIAQPIYTTSNSFAANWNPVPGAGTYEIDVYTIEETIGGFATDLFISEYVEGSSNNRYIEIYNGTGEQVNLSDYSIELYANGASSPSSTQVLGTLQATLADGETIVLKNSSANLDLPVGVIAYNASVCNFNGDDAIALKNGDNYIDIFGRIGNDPGNSWTGNGGYTTVDKTLRRKSSVKEGINISPTGTGATAFTTLTTEWDLYDINTVDGLGSHTFEGGASIDIVYHSQNQNVGSSTAYMVTGLNPETTYYYVVRAVAGTETSANSNVIEVTTTVASTIVTWTGTEWINGLPSIDEDVIIEGILTVGTDVESFEAKTLTVDTGTSIYIREGSSITVAGVIENQAAAGNFIVESGAYLIQIDEVANIGEITVFRDSQPMKRLDYTLWSSPVEGMLLKDFSEVSPSGGTGTIWNRVFTLGAIYWDQVWATQSDFQNDTTTTFTEAQGYLYRSRNDYPANEAIAFQGEFVGIPHNGTKTITTSNAYHAVGNPYPSTLDADSFLLENSGVDALYFWTNTHSPVDGSYDEVPNNWASYTYAGGTGTSAADSSSIIPNGLIATGQGFVVENSGASVTFTNEMRTLDTGMFFKTMGSEKHRLWLNLSIEDTMLNQMMVAYMDGATEGVDAQIDGKMFSYAGSALYSIITGEEDAYAIQGRSLPFTNTDVVALGFRAVQAGTYTVSLADFDGLFLDGQDIYLKDNATQTYHDLKDGAYTFVSDQGIFDSRFEVVYQADGGLNTNNPTLDNKWIVYSQDNGFQIETQGFEMKEVLVYDMLGRLVYNNQAEGTSHAISNIANGVLIVKVITTDNQVLTRKTAK